MNYMAKIPSNEVYEMRELLWSERDKKNAKTYIDKIDCFISSYDNYKSCDLKFGDHFDLMLTGEDLKRFGANKEDDNFVLGSFIFVKSEER